MRSRVRDLARRLEEGKGAPPLPDAPPTLARLAGEWWAIALRVATEHATAELAAAQAALVTERTAMDELADARRAECEQLKAVAAAAIQAQITSEQRHLDAQQMIDQLRTQLVDLTNQRDHAINRAARLDAELATHIKRQSAREEEDARLRAQSVEHLRTVENRAHTEVDRARQDIRALQKELDAVRQAHQSALTAQRDRETALRERVTEAVRETAVAQAQVAALTRQKPGPDRGGKPPAPKKQRKATNQAKVSTKKIVRRRQAAKSELP